MRKSLIAIALTFGLLAGSASAASATTLARDGSASHKVPVASEFVFKNGKYRIVWGVRPAGRFTIYSGPGVYLLRTRWTTWTATKARATGELWGMDSRLVDLGHVSIVLSAPKSHNGLVYYSALHIVGGRGVEDHWRWYWSGPEIGWTPIG
jgi:hypothetical protein